MGGGSLNNRMSLQPFPMNSRMSGVHFNLDREHIKPARTSAPPTTATAPSTSASNVTPLGLMMVMQSNENDEDYDDDSFDSYQHSKNPSARNSLEQQISARTSDTASAKTEKEEKKRCSVM
jgi:hypothetical protein